MRQNTLTVKRLLEHFMKKFAKDKLKKIQKRKSKKKKGNKLYVHQKGYENLFNNWIHKKTFFIK